MAKDDPREHYAESINGLIERARQGSAQLQIQGRALNDEEKQTVSALDAAVPLLERAAAALRGEITAMTAEDAPDIREALATEIRGIITELNQVSTDIQIQGRGLEPEEIETVEAIKATVPLLEQAAAILLGRK